MLTLNCINVERNRACLAALLCLALAGCGDNQFGQVEGIVTLDGQPLPKATVEFQPKKGSPSFGETDASGHFKLLFSPTKVGASVGVHTVRISTFRIEGDEENKISIPEKIPPEFNRESKEQREVKPGRQTLNFDVRSRSK